MGLRNRNQFLHYNCFFVTTTCIHWKKLIHLANAYDILIDSLKFVNEKYKTDILGYVLMPNHIHLIVYFKKCNELSNYMRDFKKFTSTKIRQRIDEAGHTKLLNELRNNAPNRAFQVWKDRFDDLYLKNRTLLETKLNYIHMNPLQEHWDLAKHPTDYKWSSAEFYENGKQNKLQVVHYLEYF